MEQTQAVIEKRESSERIIKRCELSSTLSKSLDLNKKILHKKNNRNVSVSASFRFFRTNLSLKSLLYMLVCHKIAPFKFYELFSWLKCIETKFTFFNFIPFSHLIKMMMESLLANSMRLNQGMIPPSFCVLYHVWRCFD